MFRVVEKVIFILGLVFLFTGVFINQQKIDVLGFSLLGIYLILQGLMGLKQKKVYHGYGSPYRGRIATGNAARFMSISWLLGGIFMIIFPVILLLRGN